MRALLIAVVIAMSMTSIQGWWCSGHMVVAQLAWNNLDIGIQTELTKIFTSLSQSGPFPQSPDMVQAACWADDIKADKLNAMGSWHYIDQAYMPNGYKPAKAPVAQEENVASVIMQLAGTAKAQKDHHNQWIQNFAVANLVHFFGDVHMPLHAATLFSPQFPNGDMGGNFYHVILDGKETSLHKIWDSVCNQWTEDLPRPMSVANQTWVKNTAEMIQNKYHVSAFNKSVYNSTVMALESFADAKEYVYGGAPAPGGVLPKEYIDRCIPVAYRRIALAGWRLYSELTYIFRDFASHKSHETIDRRAAERLKELRAERSRVNNNRKN